MIFTDIRLSSPLEREYEAWIIHGIESYFRELGEKIAVWAVSPHEERVWPADEKLLVNRKLVGLQMKRAYWKKKKHTTASIDRVHWKLNNPSYQLALVRKFPEIFYCLPTFINRDFRNIALHHCLFWRPPAEKKIGTVWYHNSDARIVSGAGIVGDAARWGRFVELIYSCAAGRPVRDCAQAKEYIESIVSHMRQPSQQFAPLDQGQEPDNYDEEDESAKEARSVNTVVYMLSLPLPN